MTHFLSKLNDMHAVLAVIALFVICLTIDSIFGGGES